MSWWVLAILAGLCLSWWQSKHGAKTNNSKKTTGGTSPATPSAEPQSTSPPSNDFFHWPELGGYEYNIVGTSFYQDALQKIAGEHSGKMARVHTVAHLIPDPNNPHDDKSVRVDIEGKTVGHLSRDDARSFRRRLGAKKIGPNTTTCAAEVWGGNTDRNGKEWGYGVKLDIKPFGW